jgi:hypothetical protein
MKTRSKDPVLTREVFGTLLIVMSIRIHKGCEHVTSEHYMKLHFICLVKSFVPVDSKLAYGLSEMPGNWVQDFPEYSRKLLENDQFDVGESDLVLEELNWITLKISK